MAFKITFKDYENTINDVDIYFENYDDFIFELYELRKLREEITIKMDLDVISLEEYIDAIKILYNNLPININDKEIKTARDMQKWMDSWLLLNNICEL
jgi:hypothetical protein